MSGDRRAPRANPWARYSAVVTGLVLLAVAAVCARELWLRNSSSIRWESWVDPVMLVVAGATFQPWMLPAGAGAVLLGGFLVWVAFRPRTRTHRELTVSGSSGASVWVRPVDIARLLSAAALRVPGVVDAAGHVTGRGATVSVTAGPAVDDPSPAVDAALTRLLADLGLDLSVRVRLRSHEGVQR